MKIMNILSEIFSLYLLGFRLVSYFSADMRILFIENMDAIRRVFFHKMLFRSMAETDFLDYL